MKLGDLEQELGSDDPEVRRRAAARLSEQQHADAVPLVMQALGDSDWRVRKEATAAAVSMAPEPAMLEALVRAFEPGDNVGLRNAAVEALAGYGTQAVEALATAVAGLDADGKKLAVEALGKSGQTVALPVLEGLLNDADANVRAAAVEAIADLGAMSLDEAVPLLERCLDVEDRFQRLAALDGLNRLGVALAWERVEPLTRDPMLARPALVAAGRTANTRAATMLVEALGDATGSGWRWALGALADFVRGGSRTHQAAARALAELPADVRARLLAEAEPANEQLATRRTALLVAGALGPEAASVVVDALSDDVVLAEAEEALGMLGAAAVPELIEHSRAGPLEQRVLSMELLGQVDDAATLAPRLDAIRAALDDDSPELACAALSALGRVGDAESLELATARLELDQSPRVRTAAAAALFELAERHGGAADELARRAAPDGAGAYAACVVLSVRGAGARGGSDQAVEFLSAVLSSDDAATRRAAVEALASLGDARGVEAVAFALTDEELEVQLAAVRALGRMRGPDGKISGVAQLLELVKSGDDRTLVAAAIRALGEAKDSRALPVLRELVGSAEPRVAVAAAEALGALGDARRVDALIEGLSHTDSEVVKAALRELAHARDPRGAAHIGACLDHEAWDVRRLAADQLGRLGGESAVALLQAKLAGESEPLVREAIRRALVELEGAGVLHTTPPPERGSWRSR